MILLPQNTFLGKLEIQDVFEFYDIPLLFTCTNESCSIFVAVSIDEENDVYKWLYSPISNETLEQLKRGILDFKTSFQRTINSFSFIVSIYESGLTEIYPINSLTIPDDWLPIAGECVEIPEHGKIIPYYAEPKPLADKENRGVINLLLDVQNEGHEISAKSIGNIITDFQELIDSLGLKHSGHKHKRIPEYISRQTELNVAFSFPGSFGLQLRSVARAEETSFTLIEEAILSFVKLMESDLEDDYVETYVNPSEHQIVAKFSRFLSTIDSLGVGFSCQYASPKHAEKISITSSVQNIVDKLSFVKSLETVQEHIDVEGMLTGLNIRIRKFEIVSTKSAIISGYILDEAFENAVKAKANVGAWCSATIIKISSYSEKTGKMNIKFFLKSLDLNKENPKISLR